MALIFSQLNCWAEIECHAANTETEVVIPPSLAMNPTTGSGYDIANVSVIEEKCLPALFISVYVDAG